MDVDVCDCEIIYRRHHSTFGFGNMNMKDALKEVSEERAEKKESEEKTEDS